MSWPEALFAVVLAICFTVLAVTWINHDDEDDDQ